MTRLDLDIDRLIAGWRGPLLAALVALLAALPGLIAMPPLDRTEARFAQATAQILEHDDWLDLRFQDRPVEDSSPAVHWLQAASVRLFSGDEARQIWPYRLPSLLGAMLAAAACAWGAARFWGQRAGTAAGIMLGAGFMLSTLGFVATADALLCGLLTVAMAALSRLYAAAREGRRLERRTRLVFWLALAISVLVKGPVGLLLVAAALATL
ncbi:MAG TPA: glycosyltransferase family 39 protein, partial [Reyranella sp.]|nr:glycosyltransferase family 39 protein [Reyranella sp.]